MARARSAGPCVIFRAGVKNERAVNAREVKFMIRGKLLETRLKCSGHSHRYVSRSFTSMDMFIFHVRSSLLMGHGTRACRVPKHEIKLK